MALRLPRSVAYRITRTVARRAPGLAPSRPHRPVFVVGSPRSGTTLLLRCLAAHPGLAVYPSEANDLWYPHTYPRATAAVVAPLRWRDPDGFQQVSAAHFDATDARRLSAAFALYQRLQGGGPLVNKSGALALRLPEILELFPDARFLHLVRDGRAVAVSYARKERTKLAAGADAAEVADPADVLAAMAAYWVRQVDEIDTVDRDRGLASSDRLLELRYEALCADRDTVLTDVAQFLDVAPTGYRVDDLPDVRPPSGRVVEQLSPTVRARLDAVLRPTLVRKGYTPSEGVACESPS